MAGDKLNQDISDYKIQLEEDMKRQLYDHEMQQNDLVRKEEERLERERDIELKEYEQALTE